MNFVNGKIEKEDGQYKFVSKAFSYAVPERYTDGISDFEGKKVILGIRPEHMSMADPDPNNEKILTGKVGVLEPIGAETYVYIDFPEYIEIIFKTEGIVKLEIDQEISIKFLEERIHFFDAESENRILPEGGLMMTQYFRELEKQGQSSEM